MFQLLYELIFNDISKAPKSVQETLNHYLKLSRTS